MRPAEKIWVDEDRVAENEILKALIPYHLVNSTVVVFWAAERWRRRNVRDWGSARGTTSA